MTPTGIVAALVVLGVIIVLHELGHFLVAKLFGIKIDTFSVGFGPRLLGFRYGETDYRISAFPLGGYVKMAGETVGDNVTGDPREFLSKPRWQRFLVAAAGPAMNMLLAVALLMGLFMYGGSFPEMFMNNSAIVGNVEPGSPADKAGIHRGDRLLAMDGKQNPTWETVMMRIAINPDYPLKITLERNGEKIETAMTPTRREEHGYAGLSPIIPNVVNQVAPGKPAATVGLLPGDEIVAVNGIDLMSSGRLIPATLQTIEEKEFPIRVLRKGELKEFRIAPVTEKNQEGKPQKMIGVVLGAPPTMVTIKLGVVDAFHLSVDKNIDNASLILTVLGKLFKPRESGGLSPSTLEGPLGMVKMVGYAYRASWIELVMLSAMISLNLGLLNLLPIPILDGGVMLMVTLEGLARRDLSLRIKERIVQVSFVALLMLTAFVIFNDIRKLSSQ